MAHGPTKQPPFSGQLTRVTREGEQGSIAFTAHTPEELRRKLAEASAALDERMKANNAALLDAASTFEERQARVYAAAIAQLRRELGLSEPAEPAGGNGAPIDHADDSAGQVHAAENP
jgi:hypothetical protein